METMGFAEWFCDFVAGVCSGKTLEGGFAKPSDIFTGCGVESAACFFDSAGWANNAAPLLSCPDFLD